MTHRLTIETPTGHFTISETGGRITGAGWRRTADLNPTGLLRRAADQVREYFEGTRTEFDLPLHVDASPTQQGICAAIAGIPFGVTRTYGELARDLAIPAQAVGQGCGGNPIALFIPCHRVLGAKTLGGFSAPEGIETKVALLRHEGAGGLLI